MPDVRLKISSPWVTYVNKVLALFQHDPDMSFNYDNDGPDLVISVANPDKAAAMIRLFPERIYLGNVMLTITIEAPNGIANRAFPRMSELFEVAFDRNPVFAFTKVVSGIFSNSLTYVVFKNKVVQFFNDNLNDIYGNISTLYQDIAEDIFADSNLHGVCFCTDIEEKVGMPLGEWP